MPLVVKKREEKKGDVANDVALIFEVNLFIGICYVFCLFGKVCIIS